jgi:hypothetical protein
MRELARDIPSWLVSAVLHAAGLLALSAWTLPGDEIVPPPEIIAASAELEELEVLELPDETPLEGLVPQPETPEVAIALPLELSATDVSPFDDLSAAATSVELGDAGWQSPSGDLIQQVGVALGSDLGGRGAGKAQWLRDGATPQSEQAVALALEWLANHQLPDGGWSFDHTTCRRCRGKCGNRGRSAARNAATGLALLPFLGAGQTHKTGQYKEQVRTGLYFLINRMIVSRNGGSLHEPAGRGLMYSHGICAIVLCEAYAMTQDQELYAPAQQAINFIAHAQDPHGGGWRYDVPQRGDTSVVGWQIMALKSGYMAYLRVPPDTVRMASRFLDGVQADGGAQYGYTSPATGREATTAIGLLCRMYLGWDHDQPALERGVRWISRHGPSKGNMYYNYYATQVMRHWEGDLWEAWNGVMRDQLVNAQARNGHEKGSWFFTGDHGSSLGGRLYSTAMAAMILEVYYRHLPIYRKQSTDEDFPLD